MNLRPGHVAVIDIGKTNAKVALVDPEAGAEVAVRTCPNRVLPGPPWPHFDLEGLWAFVIGALAALGRAHPVGAIAVTTHGAAAVLLDAAGGLAAPMLDYEHGGPDALRGEYEALRPPFAETGSPALPGGLNLGAQLHWMLVADPGLRGRLARVVTYPQYWAGRLSGVWRCEATSLGCHTDLWNPGARRFSGLVDRLGLAGVMAPLARADACLGRILPGVAAATGLAPDTPVFCGIHDSNASLLPHLLADAAPFAVVSTGTWVVCMAVGGAAAALDPARDALVNVDAFGNPVPSARFMGGREFALAAGEGAVPTPAEVARVLDTGAMLLPSLVPGCGPFPGRAGGWSVPVATLSPGERAAAAAFYLGLMADICLSMIGARGAVRIEGPMAANPLLLDMLAALRAGPVLAAGASATGTAIGAALLTGARPAAGPAPAPVRPRAPEALRAYAARWAAAL